MTDTQVICLVIGCLLLCNSIFRNWWETAIAGTGLFLILWSITHAFLDLPIIR